MTDVRQYNQNHKNGAISSAEKKQLSSFQLNNSGIKKEWSPERSREEVDRQKQLREQQYNKTLNESEKPTLLVHKKTVYKDVKTSDLGLSSGPTENVIKIANKSIPRTSNQPESSKNQNDNVKTKVYINQNKNGFGQDTITKIEGVEHLPKGFVELEPILFKDKFDFPTPVHEELFNKEQMKTKLQRIKQYDQRNREKERKVTIYTIEETKSKTLEYLDSWFRESNRLMNEGEIEYVSKSLQVQASLLDQIQKAYFKKVKARLNSKFEKDLKRSTENPKNKSETIPGEVQKYMATNPTEAYQNIESKLAEPYASYKQEYLSKYDKMLHSRKKEPIFPPNSKDMKNDKNQNDQNDIDAIGDAFKKGLKQTDPTTEYFNIENQAETEKAQNFDHQINDILTKINDTKVKPDFNSDDEGDRLLTKTQEEKFFVEFPNFEQIIAEQLQNPNEYRREANLLLSEFLSTNPVKTDDKLVVSAVADEKQTFNYKRVMFEKKNVSVLRPTRKTNNPHRNTILFKNDKGKSLIFQKIKPILYKNEYIFQTITDLVDSNNVRTVTISANWENGELIDTVNVDLNIGGNFFDSYVVDNKLTNTSYIYFRNELKSVIAKIQIKGTERLAKKKMVNVYELNGYCVDSISTEQLPENETWKVHRIRPILIGEEYFRQVVEDIIEKSNKKKLTVKTFNEKGEQVSVVKADANLIEVSNYSEIESDEIDDEGNRTIVLLTKNDQNEIIAKQTFNSNVDSLLIEHNCTQMLEEIEYEDGETQLTLAHKNSRNIINANRRVTGAEQQDDYYIEVKNDFIEDEVRYLVMIAKTFDNELLVEKLYNPPIESAVSLAFYKDMVKELREETQKLDRRTPNNKFVEFYSSNYVNFAVGSAETQGRVFVKVTDQRGVIIGEKVFPVTNQKDLDTNKINEFVNKIEKELLETGEGGIRKRKFKSDNFKSSPIGAVNDRTNAPDNTNSKNNYNYYKTNSGVQINLTESQILAENALPRFAKIPKSYFRNLVKELEPPRDKIANYVKKVEKQKVVTIEKSEKQLGTTTNAKKIQTKPTQGQVANDSKSKNKQQLSSKEKSNETNHNGNIVHHKHNTKPESFKAFNEADEDGNNEDNDN